MNMKEFEKRIEENAKILKSSVQVPDTLSEIKKEKMIMKNVWVKKQL